MTEDTRTQPAPHICRESARIVLSADRGIALCVFCSPGPGHVMSLQCERDEPGLVLGWPDGTFEEVDSPRIEAWLRKAWESHR